MTDEEFSKVEESYRRITLKMLAGMAIDRARKINRGEFEYRSNPAELFDLDKIARTRGKEQEG